MKTPDWCNVIALTAQREVVLVEQARAGIAAVTLEIPGGLVDPGEAPRDAAIRELAEESGYVAETLIPLGVVHPNPAIMNNRCHSFLALNVRPTGEQHLDEGEDITVHLRALAEVEALIANGGITHALVVAAFHHLSRYHAAHGRAARDG